jgi:thioredoxin-related protein
MIRLFYVTVLFPCIVFAQGKGVQFEQGISWNEVQAKAKSENKYIFLDCFATWCGPCKEMDKEVYPDEKLGDYMNARFISVRVQMDTSKQDDENVQKWYPDAHAIQQHDIITAYPSFLFFSPDSKILHRGLGFKSTEDFISLAASALDPDKQYYTLLENYQQGRKNYNSMPDLAETAEMLQDTSMANIVARDYIFNYLDNLSDNELCTRRNIDFIGSFIFLQNSKGRSFGLFYNHSIQIDSLMNSKGYSQGLVDYIIAKEEIDSKLWKNLNPDYPIAEKPDWEKITAAITKKYDSSYAERTVLGAQLRWYNYKNDWPEIVKYNIKKIDTYGLDTVGWGKVFLNNMIWDVIFTHSNDKKALNKGIQWMEVLLKSDPNSPNHLDTYANLLYKIGRRQEALVWEQKAMALAPLDDVKEFQDTYMKMKRGQPTWGVPASDEKKQ